MSQASHNYVSQIGGNHLVLHCEDSELDQKVRELGASHLISGDWNFGFGDKSGLASLLVALRDLGFGFVGGPAGWPPAAVFEELRDNGLLTGQYEEVVWLGAGKTQTSIK